MRRNILEATEINVYKAIKYNTYDRSGDISDFVKALDLIEGNVFISLDAKWGEGKSFFVRQVEMTLKYLLDKNNGRINEEIEEYFRPNQILNSIDLEKTYLPIYYNAWLYDNHEDPLLSLLFVLVKECGKYIDTKFDNETIGNKLLSLINSVQISLGAVTLPELSKIKERFEGKDLLETIKTSEEIRQYIKDIFDSIINESVDKLVIVIDELDRCKPSFAIEMLERIKHYYDDERIIFISSVNKEQLIHIISNHYGSEFNSTAYLNKFFDYEISLPEIDKNFSSDFWGSGDEQLELRNITIGLSLFYRLSLRDSIIFKSNLEGLPLEFVNDYNVQGLVLSVFIPTIKVLGIVNINSQREFLDGNTDILNELVRSVKPIRELIHKFNIDQEVNTDDEGFQAGIDNLIEIYRAMFSRKNFETYEGKLDIDTNIINICKKLCNKYK